MVQYFTRAIYLDELHKLDYIINANVGVGVRLHSVNQMNSAVYIIFEDTREAVYQND